MQDLMAQWTPVLQHTNIYFNSSNNKFSRKCTFYLKIQLYLHIKPFSKADTMEKVSASGDFGAGHLLVADGANIVQALEFLLGRLWERVDLFDCGAPLDENAPPGTRLTPNVKICVYTHHDGPYGAARLKH